MGGASICAFEGGSAGDLLQNEMSLAAHAPGHPPRWLAFQASLVRYGTVRLPLGRSAWDST